MREQRAVTGEELRPIPHSQALQMAVDYCLKHGIETTKQYLTNLLKERNAEGTQLRHFYSVTTHNGKRSGLMLVDVDNTFGKMLAAAMKASPRRSRGNVPKVTMDNLNPPCG